MEGKPQGDDFNASLETKNSNEVRFCVILQGRKGSVRSLLGQEWHRSGSQPSWRSVPTSPHLLQHSRLPAPTTSFLEFSCPEAFARETDTRGRHPPSFLLVNFTNTTWPRRTVWTGAVSNTAATGYISCLHLNKFK